MSQKHGIALSNGTHATCMCGYLAVGSSRLMALRILDAHIEAKDPEQ